jgi:hypothetical protein
MGSNRTELTALKNLLSQADRILETSPALPENRTGRTLPPDGRTAQDARRGKAAQIFRLIISAFPLRDRAVDAAASKAASRVAQT